MNTDFWADKNVFITGHTGFKGSWLVLWLESVGARVSAYALEPPTSPSLFELSAASRNIESFTGDIRDLPLLADQLERSNADVVFHLAAQSVVRESYVDPVETYSTNVVGTACILEAVRRVGKSCAVVNVTTDKCYKNLEHERPYQESDTLGGHDPYSNSKACSELVTQSFRDSFFPNSELERHGIALATARAGNVLGGGDWTSDQLIPDIIRSFVENREVLIRSPEATRPWQHVLDCLHGYIVLAENLAGRGDFAADAWNFGPGPGEVRPVSWIVDYLCRNWPDNPGWRLDTGDHPHEAGKLVLDSSRATGKLGWRQKLSLAQTLDWTTNWYRRYYGGGDARELCLEQIRDFMELGET